MFGGLLWWFWDGGTASGGATVVGPLSVATPSFRFAGVESPTLTFGAS